MKAKEVLFKDLANGTLFIQAIEIPNYYVFQKTMLSSAEEYGSGKNVYFDDMQKVIVVTETSFGALPINSQFIRVESAKAVGGFLVPKDILWKPRHGYAECVDIKMAYQRAMIENEDKVINLGRTFNFENVTVAELNI